MKKSLAALALATACAVPSFAGPGLADGAAKFVGNITTRGQVRSDFGQYWNQITAENECKWASIEGSRGNYNFNGCKAAYNWAKQNGGHFKFHALVWGSQYPNWLNGMSVNDTKTAITQWFDAVKKNFPDLEMIDVVNEAIRTGQGQYHSGYGKNNNIIGALGGDNNGDYNFVTTAFKMARERWPDAILIYNDYNTVQWQKNEGIQLVQTILKNGAPVDAYGQQAHDMMSQGGGAGGTGGGGVCLNINTLKSTIKEIHDKVGIPLFITEYDIATDDDNIQKQCYQEQISFFMEAPYIAGITIWGYLYGATWTTNGNSGIIKESGGRVTDRAAMTWLKSYLKSNKGENTTGLAGGTVVDPEPQTPFKGQPIAVPGKIEAEDFDVPGKGRNEDGSTNASYSVATSGQGNSDYRKGEGVNLYKSGSGVVIGYNNAGNWYEYTIDVAETGTYTVYAAVASANNTSSFKMSVGGKAISEEIAVPQAASGEENYNDYNKVAFDVNLTKGKQILRLEITGDWCDIDYFNIVKKGDADPNPIPKSSASADPAPTSSAAGDPAPASSSSIEGGDAIAQNLNMDVDKFAEYDVFTAQGMFMGRMGAYNFNEAISTVKNGNRKFAKGSYFVRNRSTGMMKSFRIVK
ncbi:MULTISPECIES: endo-1,4-beta-xylanase [unclassified Fibrobacter]|uniref:endo-1,4-beta-xylanase n=1 Tax=unclassified Fibrobacter TaxID=2634177 RepID=UPI000D7AD3EC|nr:MULTISPECIES: endo-1,4-beta-xylanase [unclassified Fibrobacter]PWJ61882.1 GH35 family endo-1,4-beta-xylanase [Fibrobacter sp. UWR4]PZW67420.1 GH35 family endo-1,4-beta-xylanase [Fibrobacter sp. UWR1]